MTLTHPLPTSAEILEKSRAIPLLTLRVFVTYKRKGETNLVVRVLRLISARIIYPIPICSPVGKGVDVLKQRINTIH